MPTNSPSDEKIITGFVADDFRVMNAQLPRRRKSLAVLLEEEHPHVMCNDGSTHLFRKKELRLLRDMVNEDERTSLLLPILLEVTSDRSEIIVRTKDGPEVMLLSKILTMPMTSIDNRITIFRPQLAVIRKTLKTTTQYLFTPAKG